MYYYSSTYRKKTGVWRPSRAGRSRAAGRRARPCGVAGRALTVMGYLIHFLKFKARGEDTPFGFATWSVPSMGVEAPRDACLGVGVEAGSYTELQMSAIVYR